jgi:hypothetical protein
VTTQQQKSFFATPTSVASTPTQQLAAPSLQVAGTPASIVLSEPLNVDLAVYRGDSGTFRISVKDAAAAPVNISSATWDADIRSNAASTSVITNFVLTPVGGDTSSIDVVLTAANSELLPSNCVYDVQMTLGGKVTTLVYGDITVTIDVSRAT